MKILNGKKLAEKILDNLKSQVKKKRLKLKLAIVLVNRDPVSAIFIRQKQKACRKVGIDFELFKFSSRISAVKLKKEIRKIAENPDNSGIVIQLPLPRNLNTEKILNLIPAEKNIEILSPVVCGIEHILKEYKISLKGKNIVLVGRGRLVGRPLAGWLRKQKIKFSNIDKIKKADIIISGAGKPNLIKGGMVKKGAIVIDAGTSFGQGKLLGDVDFKNVSKKASYITPVPGGIGPMTVACLLKNLVWTYTYFNK